LHPAATGASQSVLDTHEKSLLSLHPDPTPVGGHRRKRKRSDESNHSRHRERESTMTWYKRNKMEQKKERKKSVYSTPSPVREAGEI